MLFLLLTRLFTSSSSSIFLTFPFGFKINDGVVVVVVVVVEETADYDNGIRRSDRLRRS